MESTEEEVVKYFNTNEDNRLKVIAKHFNLSVSKVSSIMNRHFKNLKKD
jgi:hypothetical protein